MSAELAAAQGSGQTLDKQLSEARATMEKYLRDYDTLFNRTQKLTEDLEDQVTVAGLFVAAKDFVMCVSGAATTTCAAVSVVYCLCVPLLSRRRLYADGVTTPPHPIPPPLLFRCTRTAN